MHKHFTTFAFASIGFVVASISGILFWNHGHRSWVDDRDFPVSIQAKPVVVGQVREYTFAFSLRNPTRSTVHILGIDSKCGCRDVSVDSTFYRLELHRRSG